MDLPTLPVTAAKFFESASARTAFEAKVLPGYVTSSRWFGGKARDPRSFTILDLIRPDGAASTAIALVQVRYADDTSQTYVLPLAAAPEAPADVPAIARFSDGETLFDAIHLPEFRSSIMALMANAATAPAQAGSASGVRGSKLPADVASFTSRYLKVEQSNSSMIFRDGHGQDRVFVKLFRKLEEGMNPDVEITRFLSEQQQFPAIPAFLGDVEYHSTGSKEPQVLALALAMVPNDGDAWAFTLREVGAYYTEVRRQGNSAPHFTVPGVLDEADIPAPMLELLGTFAARAWQLGVRTGQMHLALAAENPDVAFGEEPLTSDDLTELSHEIQSSAQRAWGLLNSTTAREVLPLQRLGDLQALEKEIAVRAQALQTATIRATKTRTHGDYHLGQVLNTGDDFMIIDFEGEPLRPLLERKARRSPLRDVAGMLRSFHYAAHSGLTDAPDAAQMLPWAEAWAQAVSRTFLQAWRQTVGSASFVPGSLPELQQLLEALLLEKALYEVAYELNNRPAWVGIPLRGIGSVLAQPV